jgi:uncharacterized protein (UPF0548 family)
MFLVSEPSSRFICKFLSAQESESYSYNEIGATRAQPPFGYALDHNRVKLGAGQEIFDRAVAVLKTWRQFELGWVRIVPQGVPIEIGATVAILTRHFGFWSLNAARIVYVVDENGPPQRYGFAYGTLSEHAECGEERFTIELQPDGLVWYDILAFSRPNQLLVKLGFPLARRLQKRFARDSLAAMTGFCRDDKLINILP